jgi:tetratricopeptide (TPR) repeat protein
MKRGLVCAGLGLLVLVGFEGVRGHEFLMFDDDHYVTDNPLVRGGLTLAGAARAFGEFHAGNWHPLTWLSHMADVSLFGLDPRAHHLVNVALHGANAVLLCLALAALTGATWRPAVVAALFAVHPLRVESVAWVAERKDLLSAFFALLALLAWARFARAGSRGSYLAALAAFAAGLGAKPMLVTWPFVLLLVDAWPLARLRARADLWPRLRELAPFFALSAASCVVTLAAQAQAISPLPLGLRVANALLAFPAYLARVVWPSGLAALYPYRVDPSWLEVAGAGALLLALSALALAQRRRRPWLLVGWLWFAGMLVPTLGLVQVGVQAFADRYTYLPLVGLALAAVWTGAEWAERAPWRRALAACVCALALAACVFATRAQVAVWRDSVSLFAHAIAVTRDNWFAHTELGIALTARGELDAAREQLETALRLHPASPRALSSLGLVLARKGETRRGVELVREALRLDPGLRAGQLSLGAVLERAGSIAEAQTAYRAALAQRPDDATALLQLARLLAIAPEDALRDGAEAVRLAERSCALRECLDPETLDVLGLAYMEAGRPEDALRTVQRALQIAVERGSTDWVRRLSSRARAYERGEPVRVRLVEPRAGD